MSGDPETLAHYEASVPYYTLAFDRSHSRHLDAFLDSLAAGAHILELGCGTGRDAARMIERGFTVDATDGTQAMVLKANERHGVGARLMRFDELAGLYATAGFAVREISAWQGKGADGVMRDWLSVTAQKA